MFYLGKKDQTVRTCSSLTFSLRVEMAQGGRSSGMDQKDG